MLNLLLLFFSSHSKNDQYYYHGNQPFEHVRYNKLLNDWVLLPKTKPALGNSQCRGGQ
jgi:hypothetical protein